MSDFQFDAHSEATLAPLHPAVIAAARQAGATAAVDGVWFRIAQGLRTYEQQNALWQQGRTPAGVVIPKGQSGHGVVTNAKGGYSNHNFGMAFDAYPYNQGSSGSLEMQNPQNPKFVTMIKHITAAGLINGGCWKSMPDFPHFQLANIPVTPTQADRDAYAKGGLPAVWALYAQQ